MTLFDTETGEVIPTLTECEAVIDRGLGTFIEVGQALLTIRDARLYKLTHSDFDTYCRERWGWAKSTAHQVIAASGVASELSAIADTPAPTTEAQVRPLHGLPSPELRQEAWKTANDEAKVAGEKVTSRKVEEVVEKIKVRTATEQWDDAVDCFPFLAGLPAKHHSEAIASAAALADLEGDEAKHRTANFRKWAAAMSKPEPVNREAANRARVAALAAIDAMRATAVKVGTAARLASDLSVADVDDQLRRAAVDLTAQLEPLTARPRLRSVK